MSRHQDEGSEDVVSDNQDLRRTLALMAEPRIMVPADLVEEWRVVQQLLFDRIKAAQKKPKAKAKMLSPGPVKVPAGVATPEEIKPKYKQVMEWDEKRNVNVIRYVKEQSDTGSSC
jgi:hypothetical protein